MTGFSRTNLFYIRKWYLFYQEEFTPIVPQVVGQLEGEIVPQVVGQFQFFENEPFKVFTLVPWGHHRHIIDKCKNTAEALFYLQKTVQNNWSRDALRQQMQQNLHERQGLLFYHTNLHCYVVVDLKGGKFLPEYAGKMNFYCSAADDLLRSEVEQPTIGLILCRESGKRTTVEYALRNIQTPLGVSEYVLTHILPDNLKNILPTTEQLERELDEQFDLETNIEK